MIEKVCPRCGPYASHEDDDGVRVCDYCFTAVEEIEAATIKVYVVVIEHLYNTIDHEHVASKVGAVYWNEQAAREEVARFEAANSWTRAYYVERELPFPTCALDTPD